MNKTGHVSYQIKDKKLQRKYNAVIRSVGIPESEFNRLAIRHMITYVEVNNQMPPVSAARARA